MLVYHPAYDVNHGMFRMLHLLEANPMHSLQWDAFRILDMFYLFPHLLADARLPRSLARQKLSFGAQASKYSRAPAPRIFIQQLAGLHETIAASLVGKGLLEAEAFKAGDLTRTGKPLPQALQDAFDGAGNDESLVRLLAIDLAALPLAGQNGLKARTGMLEHYYDPA